MAAITPDSITTENLGSVKLIKASFGATTIADGDTWASGIPGVFGKWADINENPTTQASVGMASTLSGTTFTFFPAEDTAQVDFYVMAKS